MRVLCASLSTLILVACGSSSPPGDGAVDAGPVDASIAPDAAFRCPNAGLLCGSTCIDALKDPLHCGACSNVCPAVLHSSSVCTLGICSFVCDTNYVQRGMTCIAASVIWSSQSSPTMGALQAVWGSGPKDVYIVGDGGAILHSSGDGTWSAQASNTMNRLSGIWGSGAGDVYVVGDQGTILHSTGHGDWTPQTSNTMQLLTGVWGSGPGDVYVVGDGILHSIGDGNWTRQMQAIMGGLGVWGSGPGDVYFVGGSVQHSIGDGNWTLQLDNVVLATVWGADPTHVYAAGIQPNSAILYSTGNGSWSPQETNSPHFLFGMWGSAPTDVYAVGESGTILHSKGDGTWLPETGNTLEQLNGVWGSGPMDIYAVGSAGTILHLP
jgi:photosystem II stability/assembly factor-like uncharacterized protein